MSLTSARRRLRCERCLRPASHCLCSSIPSIAHRTRVLVLQHPEEARHPLNTARLAVLGLQNAELWVGETFAELEGVLNTAAGACLLFPEEKGAAPKPPAAAMVETSLRCRENASKAAEEAPSMAPGPRDVIKSKAVGLSEESMLVVPDGTWRQARRLVQANPVLLSLPRVSLSAGAGSQYRVRKARETAALATVEAIVQALEQLEPNQSFEALLQPFHHMVEQQIAAMGEETYRRNHAKAFSQ